MAEPTLAQVFGTGTTQDADEVVIPKSGLTGVGLIASSTNNAESLFVAFLLQGSTVLNETSRTASSDVSVVISEPSESLLTQNSIRYRVTSYTVELYKEEPASTTNPMDY